MNAHKNDEYIESLNVQINELYLKLDTLYYMCEDDEDYKSPDIQREVNKYENKILMLSNKIKDYISVPKGNGYQSIHLTIIEGQQPVEIQIRTKGMHHYAQYGMAAHHQYKANS